MTRRVDVRVAGTVLLFAVAWLVLTGIVVAVYRTMPHRSPRAALMEWAALYVFTLIVPCGWTWRLRARSARLAALYPSAPPALVRDLAQTGWACVLLGYLAAVSAVALLMSYVPR